MKTRVGLMLPCVLYAFYTTLCGQIHITRENLPAIGTVSKMEVDTTSSAVAGFTAKGETQAWNSLQPLSHATAFDFKIVRPQETPFGSKFSDADYASRSAVEHIKLSPYLVLTVPVDTLLLPFRFEKIEDDKVVGLGMELNVSIFNNAYRFKKPALLFPLPLEVNKSWIYEAEIDTAILFSGFPIPVSVVEYAAVSADAGGTLTLSSGPYDCLRLCYHWSRKFYLGTGEVTQWSDSRIIYRWVANRVGTVLEIISKKNETNAEFAEVSQITRLVSTNVSTGIVCEPDCRPAGLLPSGCSLSQNFPNPFNPSTSVQYTLTEPSRVEFRVFSLPGKEIAVLDYGAKPAGNHTVVWNGKDRSGNRLPSGMYLYRLKAVPFGSGHAVVLTKKMIMTD